MADVRGFLGILARRGWVVVITAALTFAIACLGLYLTPPTYSATALVRIAKGDEGAASYFDVGYADRLMGTYLLVLKSRSYLEEVNRQLRGSRSFEELSAMVAIEAPANTELLRITVQSPDPAEARDVAAALAFLLVEQPQSVYYGRTRSSREILGEQLSTLEQQLQADRASLTQLSQAEPGLRDEAAIGAMTARIALDERTQSTLLGQYEQARVDEALRARSISLIDPPVVPSAPSKPNVKLNLALGVLLGLVGGVGLAFLFESLDRTIHSADDLEMQSRVPVVGWIPGRLKSRRSRAGALPPDDDWKSQVDEAFGILTANALAIGGARSASFLISSAEPRAGKSFVLANLALAFVRTGRKVVVVDGNLRRPTLYTSFGVSNEIGLSDVLANIGRLSSALQRTATTGLLVLPSRVLPHSAAGLLSSPQMPNLIRDLRQQADVVLIDSPSVLEAADAALVAPLVDGVLLVVARDQSVGQSVSLALKQLERMDAKVLGIVYNRAKGMESGYLERTQQKDRLVAARQAP
jgi:capsular exopolysaccharide synthesis family protein